MVLLQALQRDYDITLLTGRPFECDRLNQTYHTQVDPDLVWVRIPRLSRILRHLPFGDALRGAWLERCARSIAQDFDLCISGYNFCDFDRLSIQFVADFSWDDEFRASFDPAAPGLRGYMRKAGFLRQIYLSLGNLLRGRKHDIAVHSHDVIVANSEWTAGLLQKKYGFDARVIYPPVYVPEVSKANVSEENFAPCIRNFS